MNEEDLVKGIGGMVGDSSAADDVVQPSQALSLVRQATMLGKIYGKQIYLLLGKNAI